MAASMFDDQLDMLEGLEIIAEGSFNVGDGFQLLMQQSSSTTITLASTKSLQITSTRTALKFLTPRIYGTECVQRLASFTALYLPFICQLFKSVRRKFLGEKSKPSSVQEFYCVILFGKVCKV